MRVNCIGILELSRLEERRLVQHGLTRDLTILMPVDLEHAPAFCAGF